MKKVEINCDICNKAFKENEYVYCQWGHRYCLECFKGAVKTKGKINELQKRIDKAIEWINEHIDTFEERNITIYDWNSLSDPKDLLEILRGNSNEL